MEKDEAQEFAPENLDSLIETCRTLLTSGSVEGLETLANEDQIRQWDLRRSFQRRIVNMVWVVGMLLFGERGAPCDSHDVRTAAADIEDIKGSADDFSRIVLVLGGSAGVSTAKKSCSASSLWPQFRQTALTTLSGYVATAWKGLMAVPLAVSVLTAGSSLFAAKFDAEAKSDQVLAAWLKSIPVTHRRTLVSAADIAVQEFTKRVEAFAVVAMLSSGQDSSASALKVARVYGARAVQSWREAIPRSGSRPHPFAFREGALVI